MIVPRIKGIIQRRILINYNIDANIIAEILPKPFTPKLVNGRAIAGICLIRLAQIRPKLLPKFMGISSENGAHRIAVEWKENGVNKEGVYIPRRDTSSRINSIAGGLLFPGIHYYAKFQVEEDSGNYNVSYKSADETHLSIKATKANVWNKDSSFQNLETASDFFEQGSIGYSPSPNGYDGIKLNIHNWRVAILEVQSVLSSFFDNEKLFPKGSVKFDNALLMENIEHEWIGLKRIDK